MLVIRNTVWLSICRIAADLSGLALFTVISRRYGPMGTGEYSYAFALGAFIAILATAGIEQYGVRQYACLHSDRERADCWHNLIATQSLQLSAGLLVLGTVLLIAGTQRASPVVILELSIFLVGWGLSRTIYVPASAAQAMVGPAFAEFACRIGGTASALVLCLFKPIPLWVILAGLPISGLVLVALALRNANMHGATLRFRASWHGVVDTVRGAAPFTVCEALGQFYMRVDLLLIVFLLGKANGGWYATDIKIIEVGLMPLVLLGTAAYPVLSRSAAHEPLRFAPLSRDFLRSVLFASGWLAVGLYCLAPLVITRLLGEAFQPAGNLLPLFAVLAVLKGVEVVLYRLLYAVRRQGIYMGALAVGTALIVVLNYTLIPTFGAAGAVFVVLLSSAVVNIICAIGLRREISRALLGTNIARLAFALTLTTLTVFVLRTMDIGAWEVAIAACLMFPLVGLLSGLFPNPRHSPLFA
ncbi:MAG TPA: oligosaccharide flippase family protein [Steroidobacteraceae bacterium]|jgi:O-antigen/teichoic acid export membrane protein|nr:oligosaccharide flippase family protein [Steroidobacteraceae bacterium]